MAVLPVIMPKLGAYTDDVLLAAWLVGEGDEVARGAPIFELETEKTTAEVEAESSGWVHRLVAAGATVPIGSAVALLAETREDYDALAAAEEERNPFLRSIARDGGNAAARAGAVARPARVSPHRGGPIVAPRARTLLEQLGFSLDDAAGITGSGPGGRIVDRDVAAWAAARASPHAQGGGADPARLSVTGTVPLRGRRGAIAARMVASLQTAAQLTSVLELDVKPLVELRARLNEAGAAPRVGVTAIVVKLVAAALGKHPLLNARVTETAIELLGEINVAVAVETDDGLLAPVVTAADRLSLEEINARIIELAARARGGALTASDLAGGTFTVSNGGVHPVDITTAILNPPQCGILWIGRIRDRPVVDEDGAIVARPTMQACLTFDHRAIDGAPAAAFLATFAALVAELPRLPS